MKIISLEASNVKRLSAVSVAADGAPVVVVGGDNGHGKSSLLDSIAYAFAGKSAIPEKPVREGAKKAEIVIKLDGDPALIIQRRFTKKGTTLEVFEDRESGRSKLTTPQAVLDALCSRVAFDPLSFTRLKPSQQVDALKELLGIDTDEIDSEIGTLFDERTMAGRELRQAEGQYGSFPDFGGVPDAPIDVAALSEKVEEAVAHNAHIRQLESDVANQRRHCDYTQSAAEDLRDRAAELRAEANALEADAKKKDGENNKATKDLNAMVADMESLEEIPLESLREELAEASQTNERIAQKAEAARTKKRLDNLREQHEALSRKIDSLRERRVAMIDEAKWPVDGLSFGEGGVEFNGLPFEQASSAEQLRIAVAIGCAVNPELRIMLIRDGSLLDKKSMAILSKLAEETNSQLWIERVSKGKECTVVIEDGSISHD